MAPTFDSIRGRIDAATSLWVGLPTAGGATDAVTATKDAALLFGAASGGGTSVANTSVIDAAAGIENTVDTHMSGSFKTPFIDKYSVGLKTVVQNNGCVAAILQTAYAAESAIAERSPIDATAICDNVRNAFAERAGEAVGDIIDVSLTAVTAAAAVVTTIASAGTTAAIATLAGLASTATSAVKELRTTAEVRSGSFEEIMSQLESASDSLNSSIRTIEEQVATMVSATNTLMTSQADRDTFDLDKYVFKRELLFASKIAMTTEDVNTVQLKLDAVHGALDSAKRDLADAPGDAFIRRASGTVGIGAIGAYSSIAALHESLISALHSSRDEVTIGKELLQRVHDDFAAAESTSAEDLTRLSEELDGKVSNS